MSNKKRTCEERISEELEGRLSYLRGLFTIIDADDLDDIELDAVATAINEQDVAWLDGEEPDGHGGKWLVRSGVVTGKELDPNRETYDLRALKEAAEERLDEWSCGNEFKVVMRIELSGGGPSDHVELVIDDGDVASGSYHFLNWFDGSQRTLTGGDLKLFERFAQHVYPIDSVRVEQ